jgi:hypothetical protein
MLVVTTPPTRTDLTTLSSAMSEINDPAADQSYIGASLIPAASAAIARWCNREFGVATYTETFRIQSCGGYTSPGKSVLMLSRCPVTSVTSVTEGTDPALTAGYIETDLDNGFVYRLSGSDARQNWTAAKVVVVYTAGWTLPGATLPNLPADIQRACILLCRDWYLTRARDVTLRSIGLAGVTTTMGTGNPGVTLPAHVEALLLPWRLAVL